LFLLWIDLICINQLNENEKSVQVVRMRETYKDACKVIVWLGDDPERRKATGEVASFLSKHLPPTPDGAMYVSPEPTYLLEPQHAVVLRTLCRDILRRPWWWRMWVIQEIALARSIVVICDGYHLSWEHLVYTTQWIRILDIGIMISESDDENPYMPNIDSKSLYRHKLVFGGNVDLPILGLLQNATSCLASDPRDMIYSLLGLAADIKSYHPPIPSRGEKEKKGWAWQPCGYGARNRPRSEPGSLLPNPDTELLVDYEKRSVEQVYVDFARVYIRTHETNPLDVITCSRFSRDIKPKHHLPSWVPDWSNLRDTACFSFASPLVMSAERAAAGRLYLYHASGTRSQQQPEFTPNNGLRVMGIRFDDVSHVGKPWEEGDSETMDRVLRDWMHLALGDELQRADGPYPCSSQTLLDVLNRTITADTSLLGSRLLRREGHLFLQRMLASTSPLDRRLAGLTEVQEQRAMLNAWRAVTLRVRRRRFFVTSKGFFGLGPWNTEPGDVVFVLYGCSVPVVLRRRGSGGEVRSFVGEAFVAGIMDGEVVQAQAEAETEAANDRSQGDGSGSLLKGREESVEIW
jgi:hypothetical protein